MTKFDDIRPYHDGEVQPTINRLLTNNEFIDAICAFKLSKSPRWVRRILRPFAKHKITKELSPLQTVQDVQVLCEKYLHRIIDTTTTHLTFSGLENLSKDQAYCFISNHRDIVMDPAFVNYALYHHGINTARQAIGDNLIQKPFVSDLMRLNKSFIVKRSASGVREKLQAYVGLSSYINHSIAEGNSIWIAQKEGRAKDGIDSTDPAIIKMFYMSQKKSGITFSDYINWLNIVPVTISYEFNPCDLAIAQELYEKQQTGHYEKQSGEDERSIVTGITGNKGAVHVSFGKPLAGELSSPEMVANAIDQQMARQYFFHPSNYLALEQLDPENVNLTTHAIDEHKRQQFLQRMKQCTPELRDLFLKMYANPLLRHNNTNQQS